MTLTAGLGPLGVDPAGWFTPALPNGAVYVEPHKRRIRALLNGQPVIDTEGALMVHRRGHALSYAFWRTKSATLRTNRCPKPPVTPRTLGRRRLLV